MNWDVIEENWAHYQMQVKAQWHKLTSDHVEAIAGKRDQLARQIQTSYGVSGEEVDLQIRSFQKYLKASRPF